jgi:hypothetical protein
MEMGQRDEAADELYRPRREEGESWASVRLNDRLWLTAQFPPCSSPRHERESC